MSDYGSLLVSQIGYGKNDCLRVVSFEGPLVHQSFKIEHLVLPTGAPRAAVAWARVAELLPPLHHARATDHRARAKRALRWFLKKPRHVDQSGCGLRKDQLFACHLSTPEAPVDHFAPVSMIHGIGKRTAGSWLNLTGAICNGFAIGDQFVWDCAVDAATDGPHSFTDEDWITHAGGWLSGIARWTPVTRNL